LTINPKYEDALYNKGYDLEVLGNYTGTILYYGKALAIDPHDIDALNNKGVALNSLENYREGLLWFLLWECCCPSRKLYRGD